MFINEKEDNAFQRGISLYREINNDLEEIFDCVKKNSQKKTEFKNNFNYLMQSFLFYLTIPKDEVFLSFLKLLFIVDIGNLNSRLDFAIKKKTNLVFLLLAEKKKSEVKLFCKEVNKFISSIRRSVLKIFNNFNNFKKDKNAVYDKISINLAMIIECFLNLEERTEDKDFLLKIVKKSKKFFFNI